MPSNVFGTKLRSLCSAFSLPKAASWLEPRPGTLSARCSRNAILPSSCYIWLESYNCSYSVAPVTLILFFFCALLPPLLRIVARAVALPAAAP
eukprot:2016221-Pleurochrysis_carterae.AAC.1